MLDGASILVYMITILSFIRTIIWIGKILKNKIIKPSKLLFYPH